MFSNRPGAPLWKGTGHLDVRVSLRDGGTFQALFQSQAVGQTFSLMEHQQKRLKWSHVAISSMNI